MFVASANSSTDRFQEEFRNINLNNKEVGNLEGLTSNKTNSFHMFNQNYSVKINEEMEFTFSGWSYGRNYTGEKQRLIGVSSILKLWHSWLKNGDICTIKTTFLSIRGDQIPIKGYALASKEQGFQDIVLIIS